MARPAHRQPISALRFYLTVVLWSLPLWLAAQFLDVTKIIPIKLPLSALQFAVVAVVALVMIRRHGGSARALLARGLDVKRLPRGWWWLSIFAVMPLTVGLSEIVNVALGVQLPGLTPLVSLPAFLAVYSLSAYCEQLGWTAIMTDALLKRHSVALSGLLMGLGWAAWHIIPFIQTHNPLWWVVGQCTFTVIYRILLTKVYVATNRSVFSTVAMHATYNTAFSMLPLDGSTYNPWTMVAATALITVIMYRAVRAI